MPPLDHAARSCGLRDLGLGVAGDVQEQRGISGALAGGQSATGGQGSGTAGGGHRSFSLLWLADGGHAGRIENVVSRVGLVRLVVALVGHVLVQLDAGVDAQAPGGTPHLLDAGEEVAGEVLGGAAKAAGAIVHGMFSSRSGSGFGTRARYVIVTAGQRRRSGWSDRLVLMARSGCRSASRTVGLVVPAQGVDAGGQIAQLLHAGGATTTDEQGTQMHRHCLHKKG